MNIMFYEKRKYSKMIFRLAFKHIFLSAESSYWQLVTLLFELINRPRLQRMVDMRVTSPVCTPIYMLIMSFEPIYTFVSTRYGVDWLLASASQLCTSQYKLSGVLVRTKIQ